MRIAYLVNQYPTVSHSFIRREILALERLGFEVSRFAIRGWDVDLADPQDRAERERTRFVLRSGVPALAVAAIRTMLSRPVRFIKALATAWRMSRRAERPLPVHLIYVAEACCIEAWLRASKIEHLHAHFGTNSAEVAMLVHVLGGPPWSFTAHGTETFDNPGLVGLAEKASRCAFVVAVSSYGRAQICRSLEPTEWSKVHVVHCGLDPEFLAGPVTPFSDAKRLVCVARLSPEKGHTVLLQAARRLNEEGLGFELVLAGDGPLRAEMETMIASYGLRDKVRITGWLSGAEVRREIAASRALLLTSFAEGLPVVLMEAMALSRPVIATFVAGVPELVKPGTHGWLVPAGDVDELAHAMRECLQADRDALMRMGAAAQARVLERHNVDSSARQLAGLFEQSRKPKMSYSSD